MSSLPVNNEKPPIPEAIEDASLGSVEGHRGDHDRPTRDWTDSEERKIKFKLDAVLLSCLMMGFFALQLDKTNISSAITTTFVKDIGITNNIVNNGNQILFAAIVAFEIPSNMILAKVGAPVWLTFECFAWGMVALFQAFIHNQASYYATRFLLGLFEAGYLAGSLVVIGTFYTKQEIALRMTFLYTSNYLAAGTSTLIAAGIFRLDGAAGLRDWQWLFIIDGIFTVLVALIFLLFLPSKPQMTRPVIGLPQLDMFTDRERDIMARRIALEDRGRAVELSSITLKDAFQILVSNRYIWIHAAIALISLVPKGGLLIYGPTIVKNLGFDKFMANILVSVCNFALILLAVMAARVSDWLRLRGPVCLACTAYALIFAGVQYALGTSSDKWAKYAVFVLFMAGNATFQGINSAWLSANVRDPKALCLGQALVVMGANLAGLIGQQLFRDDDAPRYTRGFMGIMCLYGATFVFLVGVTLFYALKNRNLVRRGQAENSDGDEVGQTMEERKFEI